MAITYPWRRLLALALLLGTVGVTNLAHAADDAAVTADLPTETTESAGSLNGRWHALMSNDEFQAAAELAAAWVQMVEKRAGDEAQALLAPLQRQGLALESAQQYAQARVVYTRAIRIAETQLGAFAHELVDPLTGLGRALLAEDRHEEAAAPLLQAQGITQRNLGIFSTRQDNIVTHLTNSYMAQGKFILADQQQFFALAAFEKEYGDSPELVTALQRWARWNAMLGRYAKVGESLDRALQILEDAYGPNDLRLLETLDLMIEVYRDHPSRAHAREGELAMQRMIDIYQAQPLVDQADLLAAQTRMGDWYLLAQSRKAAFRQYGDTVAAATKNDVDQELIDQQYGDPKKLFMDNSYAEFFGRGVHDEDGPSEPGYIVIQFDVTPDGDTANIRVVKDTVDNSAITGAAVDRVETAVYRPRFVDGQPVRTNGLQNLFEVKVGGKGLVLGQVYVPERTQR